MSDRNGDVGTLTGGTGEALADQLPGKVWWIAPTGRGSGPTHERGVQMRERAAGGIAQGGGGLCIQGMPQRARSSEGLGVTCVGAGSATKRRATARPCR